ncbi:PQQ-dependent sugar dehydrogenase [Myxococcaceae bacterium GXIMD 01537]
MKALAVRGAVVLAVQWCLLSLGCSGTPPNPLPLAPADGGRVTDGGTEDAGTRDGGAGDGGTGDGGAEDGGVETPDAGPTFGLDARPSNPTCIAPARPVEKTGVTTRRAFSKLSFSQPLLALQAPGDASRVFVVQRGGIVRVFPNDETVESDTVFVDLRDRVNAAAGGEAGLLGLAFHPRFATNGEVFISYTGFRDRNARTGLTSYISRFKVASGGATLDAGSEQILLSEDQPYSNHNGGNIAFGPDGFLYIGFGDGGNAGDPGNRAQDLTHRLGKMLRIDVDGAAPGANPPYAIPSTNPFRGGGGRPEIYAWGFRNPWRWSFDRATGEMWMGDVGQNELEEVNRIVLGGNYGWRIKEANKCYNASTCSSAGLIDPVVQYEHSQGVAITGGYVYRGTTIPSLVGRFLFGDFSSGRIWAVTADAAGQPTMLPLLDTSLSISSFGELVDGELLVLDYSGSLHKLVPSEPASPSTFPQKLSATGCVDASDPRKPAPGLIPFDVNSPLWSDGAGKERYFAVPDGKTVRIAEDGDWVFPEGSVLMKTFLLGGKRVETRLMMRHPDGSWGGYTYEWDEAQTDATLLPASKTLQVGGQSWYFPSRAECLQCHTPAAGFSLGPETGQLNRDLTYPATGRVANQLRTLAHIGLFEAPLPGEPSTLVRYPVPTEAGPVDVRARAYLHSNCSHCHRPQGPGRGPADFRFSTPFSQVGVCNVAPQQGSAGLTDPLLVAPGDPSRSVLSARIHALDVWRMPPLGTRVVDAEGAAVVDAWITSLSVCP